MFRSCICLGGRLRTAVGRVTRKKAELLRRLPATKRRTTPTRVRNQSRSHSLSKSTPHHSVQKWMKGNRTMSAKQLNAMKQFDSMISEAQKQKEILIFEAIIRAQQDLNRSKNNTAKRKDEKEDNRIKAAQKIFAENKERAKTELKQIEREKAEQAKMEILEKEHKAALRKEALLMKQSIAKTRPNYKKLSADEMSKIRQKSFQKQMEVPYSTVERQFFKMLEELETKRNAAIDAAKQKIEEIERIANERTAEKKFLEELKLIKEKRAAVINKIKEEEKATRERERMEMMEKRQLERQQQLELKLQKRREREELIKKRQEERKMKREERHQQALRAKEEMRQRHWQLKQQLLMQQTQQHAEGKEVNANVPGDVTENSKENLTQFNLIEEGNKEKQTTGRKRNTVHLAQTSSRVDMISSDKSDGMGKDHYFPEESKKEEDKVFTFEVESKLRESTSKHKTDEEVDFAQAEGTNIANQTDESPSPELHTDKKVMTEKAGATSINLSHVESTAMNKEPKAKSQQERRSSSTSSSSSSSSRKHSKVADEHDGTNKETNMESELMKTDSTHSAEPEINVIPVVVESDTRQETNSLLVKETESKTALTPSSPSTTSLVAESTASSTSSFLVTPVTEQKPEKSNETKQDTSTTDASTTSLTEAMSNYYNLLKKEKNRVLASSALSQPVMSSHIRPSSTTPQRAASVTSSSRTTANPALSSSARSKRTSKRESTHSPRHAQTAVSTHANKEATSAAVSSSMRGSHNVTRESHHNKVLRPSTVATWATQQNTSGLFRL